jgi:hypothetical protein
MRDLIDDFTFDYDTTNAKELAIQLTTDLITLNNNLYVKLGNGYFSEDDEKKLKEAFNLTCKAQLIAMKISKRI